MYESLEDGGQGMLMTRRGRRDALPLKLLASRVVSNARLEASSHKEL